MIRARAKSTRTHDGRPFSVTKLACLGGLLCLVFAAINFVWLYPTQFGLQPQPIVATVGLYFLASAVWLWSLFNAQGIRSVQQQAHLTLIIFWFAVCFRAIQICAPPILELDLYRYMWDGIVVNSGTSPYLYSPQQALTQDVVIEDATLRKLSELATKTPAHHAIVSNVHFAEYTTIYPPVSQFVFAATMWCVPDNTSAVVQVTAMKFTMVVFDLLTMLLVWGLLRIAGVHVGWLVAYGWNPLVVKEIANSGHLDSIAVCFVVAAFCLFLKVCKSQDWTQPEGSLRREPDGPRKTIWCELGFTLSLALGTAAKLFPVIFVPFFATMLTWRRGWSSAARFCVLYLLFSTVLMSWMLRENDFVQTLLRGNRPNVAASADPNNKEGLNGFLKHWRMNDSVFTLVFENSKPNGQSAVNRAWYVVTPNSWRQKLDKTIRRTGWSDSPPFFVARVFSVSFFAGIYGLLLMRLKKRLDAQGTSTSPHQSCQLVLETAFLIVAAFFVLQPTQNPWYWVWAMPFVCFSRNRGWLFVSVCVFTYYLRFLFKFSDLEFHFGGIVYQKAAIFDHCVAWLEHAAIFMAIIVGMLHNLRGPVHHGFEAPRIEKSD